MFVITENILKCPALRCSELDTVVGHHMDYTMETMTSAVLTDWGVPVKTLLFLLVLVILFHFQY